MLPTQKVCLGCQCRELVGSILILFLPRGRTDNELCASEGGSILVLYFTVGWWQLFPQSDRCDLSRWNNVFNDCYYGDRSPVSTGSSVQATTTELLEKNSFYSKLDSMSEWKENIRFLAKTWRRHTVPRNHSHGCLATSQWWQGSRKLPGTLQ